MCEDTSHQNVIWRMCDKKNLRFFKIIQFSRNVIWNYQLCPRACIFNSHTQSVDWCVSVCVYVACLVCRLNLNDFKSLCDHTLISCIPKLVYLSIEQLLSLSHTHRNTHANTCMHAHALSPTRAQSLFCFANSDFFLKKYTLAIIFFKLMRAKTYSSTDIHTT